MNAEKKYFVINTSDSQIVISGLSEKPEVLYPQGRTKNAYTAEIINKNRDLQLFYKRKLIKIELANVVNESNIVDEFREGDITYGETSVCIGDPKKSIEYTEGDKNFIAGDFVRVIGPSGYKGKLIKFVKDFNKWILKTDDGNELLCKNEQIVRIDSAVTDFDTQHRIQEDVLKSSKDLKKLKVGIDGGEWIDGNKIIEIAQSNIESQNNIVRNSYDKAIHSIQNENKIDNEEKIIPIEKVEEDQEKNVNDVGSIIVEGEDGMGREVSLNRIATDTIKSIDNNVKKIIKRGRPKKNDLENNYKTNKIIINDKFIDSLMKMGIANRKEFISKITDRDKLQYISDKCNDVNIVNLSLRRLNELLAEGK